MKKHYQITVPQPCKEDWDAMTPDGNGRFCSSCQHSLIDFSNMNDNELLHFFLSNKIQCGHFSSEQLDRQLVPDRRNMLPTVNLRAIAMGFGIFISTTALASGSPFHNSSINLVDIAENKASISYFDNSSEVDEYCHFLVVNSKGEHLAGVRLELLDERGNVADVIITDDKGMAIYNRMRIKFLRIREIRVIAESKKYEKIIVPFQGADRTDHEVIRLDTQMTRKDQKRARKMKNFRTIGCPSF